MSEPSCFFQNQAVIKYIILLHFIMQIKICLGPFEYKVSISKKKKKMDLSAGNHIYDFSRNPYLNVV